MITEDAVLVVYKKLKAVTTLPVHKYARPNSTQSGTYLVVNALPIDSGIVQRCIINVNVYADDIQAGQPDMVTIVPLTRTVISTLDETCDSTQNIQIFFQQENLFVGEEPSNHYSNMRFEIILLNT